MKRLFFFFLLIAVMLSLSACMGNTAQSHTNDRETTSLKTLDASQTSDASVDTVYTNVANSSNSSGVPVKMPTISILIGDQTFYATLYNNPSANALTERLPLTLEMQELSSNEKCFYFSENYPSDSVRVDEIQAGDLMLFGSDCPYCFTKALKLRKEPIACLRWRFYKEKRSI